MPSWHTSEAGGSRAARCHVPARLHGLFADALVEEQISVVEVLEKLREERVTVRSDGFLDSLENAFVDTVRIVWRLQKERRDSRNDDGLADALGSVFSEVARHFSASHGEANEREIMQLEVCNQFVQI